MCCLRRNLVRFEEPGLRNHCELPAGIAATTSNSGQTGVRVIPEQLGNLIFLNLCRIDPKKRRHTVFAQRQIRGASGTRVSTVYRWCMYVCVCVCVCVCVRVCVRDPCHQIEHR